MKLFKGLLAASFSVFTLAALPTFAHAYDARFNHFLYRHPGIAADLRSNPSLLYDPAYRQSHYALREFLINHPNEWARLQQETSYYGRGWGDWDDTHVWRDGDWWRDHNPEWVRVHHRDWWERWHNDGDWDDAHQWHPRDWWRDNNPEWSRAHRSDWWDRWHNDGDWDDAHQWHHRDWYREHNPNWSRAHRPDWWQQRQENIERRHEAREQSMQERHLEQRDALRAQHQAREDALRSREVRSRDSFRARNEANWEATRARRQADRAEQARHSGQWERRHHNDRD